MVAKTTWNILNLAAASAPPVTDIPRVPMIRPELHDLVWGVYTACQYRDMWMGVHKLWQISEGPVVQILLGSTTPDGDALTLRFYVRNILGLRKWR